MENIQYSDFSALFPELELDVSSFSRLINLVRIVEGNICEPDLFLLYIAHYASLEGQNQGASPGGEVTEVWSREEKIRFAQSSVDRSSLRSTPYGNMILRRKERTYQGGYVF